MSIITNKHPVLTIITPVYNRAKLVGETIESILNQNYSNLEYIILDDGSKDNSRNVIKKYKNKARIYSHKNIGETRTVNRGFSLARGKYIMVVNSDDPLYPGAITESIKFMQNHPKIAVAYPDWDYIDEKGKIISHVKVPEFNFQYMVGEHKCFIGPGAIIRREAIALSKGRDPEFRYVGDFDFWLRLGLKMKFARIPKTLATFRIHKESASIAKQSDEMSKEDIKMINKFYSYPNLPKKILKIKNQAYASAYFHAAQVSGNKKTALMYFLKSCLIYPQKLFRSDFYKAFIYIILLKK